MKKAFTLVELLAVIVILGIIALITYPIINNSIEQSKQGALEKTIKSIEEAAYKYSIKNDLGYSSIYQSLSLEQLQSSGFLKNDIINPVTNNQLAGCVLYRWNDVKNQYEFKYSETCEVNSLPDSLINILKSQYIEESKIGLVKDENNENLYYYTGTDEQVSNNYLWYGGHQWRVIEFDTKNNTLTLITQQPLTSIYPSSVVWETKDHYESSYVNKWLNEYFWNSLDDNIKSNVLDSTYNIGIYTDVDGVTITKKVGLLDQKQYERAGSVDSFLDLKDYWWLGNRYDSSNIRNVDCNGELSYYSFYRAYGVRAVIKISDLVITGGDGTIVDSYHTSTMSTNTNNIQVGEYINVPYNGSDNACGNDNMCTFRVVSKDNDSVKIVLNGLLPNFSLYGSSTTITTSSTIYIPLNKFANGISNVYRYTGNKKFYIGDYSNSTINYKDIQDEILQANVGLPTIGEMFSGNDIDLNSSDSKIFIDIDTIENPKASDYYWTMNRNNSSSVRSISGDGVLGTDGPSFESAGVRVVIYLKSGLIFTGGNGTAQDPYTLK